jgi:hypothetical protein
VGSFGNVSLLGFEIEAAEGPLFDVIAALHAAGGFARGLDGGQEESNEDADDGDHDEEFHERESSPRAGLGNGKHD